MRIFKTRIKVRRLSLGLITLLIGLIVWVGYEKVGSDKTASKIVESKGIKSEIIDDKSTTSQKDIEYEIEVSLSGGSGRISILSPTVLKILDEEMVARIEWSSSNYDLMVVNGKEYLPINNKGSAVFEIPISALDTEIKVQAETVAMSEPYMIDYILYFDSSTMEEKTLDANNHAIQTDEEGNQEQKEILEKRPEISGLTYEKTMKLDYANQFIVDYYKEGYKLIRTTDQRSFLVIPEGKKVPSQLSENVQIIKQPLSNIYLAATSTMGLFDALESLDAIRFSGLEAEDWYIENAKEAMEQGKMTYAGKYRNPNYELILSENCPLAIQSSMIDHVPEVREKLEELGVTVFVDRSSYEAHPLGRCEWIKVYGALLNQEEEAEALFEEQVAYLEEIEGLPQTEKKVAFFYVSSAGQIVIRKSGDYLSKMIELAGGENILYDPSHANGTSSMTMEMEHFYATAKEADILIYNSTIDGEITTISELISKMELLSEFKAVKEGNVFCTQENVYQETMKIGEVINDMHAAFTTENKDDEVMQFLYRLEKD